MARRKWGRTVYRNLEAQNKFDYAVDLYEMSVIEERLGMTRETLVAMAMLVGCDYDEGIRDIGIEKAQELFRELRSTVQLTSIPTPTV